jgi:signal transduction histidine kinase
MIQEKKEVDLKQLILDIKDQLIPTRDIDVVFATDMPVIMSHRNQIEQILHNLFSNAVKFSPQENAKIIWSSKEDDDFYEISIQDNGIGIEEKYFEKIFKIFQSLSVRQDSTGVGLAIVKKVVNALGGEVWLTSEYGTGTTFFFTIPKSQTQ